MKINFGTNMTVQRILYIDIDSLRPDHLSCYGYGRETSPNIHRLAEESVRLGNCYASDLPCAPSRMAMFTGQFGIHNGVTTHGGSGADPLLDPETRTFRGSALTRNCWMNVLRDAGVYTCVITPFASRHGLGQFTAGFREVHDPGHYGHDIAADIMPTALDWLDRNGQRERWFLHLNYWDVHVPYRVPVEHELTFEGMPPDDWMTDELCRQYVQYPGRRSFSQTFNGGRGKPGRLQPEAIRNCSDWRAMINGYDTAIHYVDLQIGLLLDKLDALGILDQTAVIVTADHGDDLGEAGSVGHAFATEFNACIPMIVRWPGVTDQSSHRQTDGLHYHLDLPPTVCELLDIDAPEAWNGRSFAGELHGQQGGRDHLVVSELAQGQQRSVRFRHQQRDYIYTRTWNSYGHPIPDQQLFDLSRDPCTRQNLAAEAPRITAHAGRLLSDWHAEHGRRQ